MRYITETGVAGEVGCLDRVIAARFLGPVPSELARASRELAVSMVDPFDSQVGLSEPEKREVLGRLEWLIGLETEVVAGLEGLVDEIPGDWITPAGRRVGDGALELWQRQSRTISLPDRKRLLDDLSARDQMKRIDAIHALEEAEPDSTTLDALTALLSDESQLVASTAALALADLGDATSFDEVLVRLAEAVKEANEDAAVAFALAAERMADASGTAQIRPRLDALRQVIASLPPQGRDLIERKLKTP